MVENERKISPLHLEGNAFLDTLAPFGHFKPFNSLRKLVWRPTLGSRMAKS